MGPVFVRAYVRAMLLKVLHGVCVCVSSIL